MATNHYVRPSSGGWVVVKEGHRRGSVRTATKREAVSRAKALVRGGGGGEVRVLNSAGKMMASDTVAPSKARGGRRRTHSR